MQNIFGISVVDEFPSGGGDEIYQEAVSVIKNLYPNKKFKRAFEWCAGPGVLGFALLGSGIAETLCLADIHDPSVGKANSTIEFNKLDNVSVYLSDNLKNVPLTEKWDLVISNPPHFSTTIRIWPNVNPRLYVDPDWSIHRDFFKNINNYLLPGGKVFLWESAWGSSPDTFKPWIEEAGLKIVNVGNSVSSVDPEYWYWIELEKA
jgi:methylase of polypeptide subunit release factors